MNEPLIFFAMLLPTIVVSWVVILWAMSQLGPWSKLVEQYPERDLDGSKTSWNSMRSGLMSYSNCLQATATIDHLTLVPILPFRLFHPPFTVSRKDVRLIYVGKSLLIWPCAEVVISGKTIILYGPVVKSPFFDALRG